VPSLLPIVCATNGPTHRGPVITQGTHMTIAANFRRFAEAMARQLPLPFSRALVWHTKRPTTTWGRAIRATRARLAAARGRIVYRVTPAYWKPPRDPRDMRVRQLVLMLTPRETQDFPPMPDWFAALEAAGQMRLNLH
jgi:hypothetical protein